MSIDSCFNMGIAIFPITIYKGYEIFMDLFMASKIRFEPVSHFEYPQGIQISILSHYCDCDYYYHFFLSIK